MGQLVSIAKIADVGPVYDLPSHNLPPEAWTDSLNLRFRQKQISTVEGWARVMDPPSVAPAFLMNIESAGDSYWLYASAVGAGSKVYAFNSGAHGDISQAGDYTVVNSYAWNGAVFQGIPILNYGSGTPQYWSNLSLAQDLQDFPAWPANTTAAVVRAFRNFIVALNITDSNGVHIHRVFWSDGADPGTMPSSWDVDDLAVEANHRDLSDVKSGSIVDGYPLRDFFVIYKKESTWLMRYIGGQSIMSTVPVVGASGLLAPECVKPVTLSPQKQEVHFLHTGVDLGIFDGQGFESVVDSKIRDKMLEDMDPVHFRTSYVVVDEVEKEAIFAFPMNGSSRPDMAVVWDYRENKAYFREFVGTHAISGVVEEATAETWTTVIGTWEQQGPAKWQDAKRRKVVIADQADTRLQQLGGENTHDGVSFNTRLLRRGLAVVGQDRQGDVIVDITKRKLVTRIWIRATGGPFDVRIGGEEYPAENDDESGITWLASQTFDPADNVGYLDFVINTRLIALELTATGDEPFHFSGYDIEVDPVSEH